MNGVIANLAHNSKFNGVHILGPDGLPLCHAPVIRLDGPYIPGKPRKRVRLTPIIQTDLGEATCFWCRVIAKK